MRLRRFRGDDINLPAGGADDTERDVAIEFRKLTCRMVRTYFAWPLLVAPLLIPGRATAQEDPPRLSPLRLVSPAGKPVTPSATSAGEELRVAGQAPPRQILFPAGANRRGTVPGSTANNTSATAPAQTVAPTQTATAQNSSDNATDSGNGKAAAEPSRELHARIQKVLAHFKDQRLNSQENSPWQVMHRVVAYGVETQIEVGRPGGQKQPAIGWLLFNQPFRGQRILTTRQGKVYGVEGAGVQGHAGQLLAILAQSQLQRDYPIHAGGAEFTVEDLIRSEQLTCRSGTELTFKLIGLSHYLPSDATWTSDDGQRWSIERLVREEIAQRIQGGTCGGTHRLMGLTYAVVTRKRQGLELTGDFKRAATYLNDYLDYALKLRNPDGSFSTSFLEGRAADPDPAARLRTTGHVLEWMVFAMSDEALRDPQVIDSVTYLTQLLEQQPQRAWEIGPLGHALHALAIYDRRVWGEQSELTEDVSSAFSEIR